MEEEGIRQRNVEAPRHDCTEITVTLLRESLLKLSGKTKKKYQNKKNIKVEDLLARLVLNTGI